MTDQKLCTFCGKPTKHERRVVDSVREWGGAKHPIHSEGDFCVNPKCHAFDEKVATRTEA